MIIKIFKFLSILFVTSLFTTSTALAVGNPPVGGYQISPVGGTNPQNISFIANSNPSHYAYRAFATCTNGVGGSNHKTIFGSWQTGTAHPSQTPNCNTIYTNGLINTAGFQYDKTKQIDQVCYTYGEPDSGFC